LGGQKLFGRKKTLVGELLGDIRARGRGKFIYKGTVRTKTEVL